MAASHSDSYLLSQDSTFQHRVQAALATACVAISNEGWNVPFHRERTGFVAQILSSLSNVSTNSTPLFSISVATDTNCLSDATQAGTVVLTGANAQAQAALVTDAHIDAAIASQFNAFIRVPS